MKDSSLDKGLDEILKDYRQTLNQQMGLILSNRHRLDIETADKMLIDEPKQAIKELITKREREARIDELKELIKPRECYRPSCKQEHTLLRKKYVKDRIEELNTSEGE